MYCPTCGSEERQLSQYCRACGTDLRSVRSGLETSDALTVSAVSARESISRAVADKIRQMESSSDWGQIAEVLLPGIEKFLESPEEQRLRRIRSGVVTASIGLGVALLILLASMAAHDLLPFVGVGLVAFFIGVGILINGLAFTVPRKKLPDKSNDARAQEFLDSQVNSGPGLNLSLSRLEPTTNQLGSGAPGAALPSVTEHTTHQLKPNKT